MTEADGIHVDDATRLVAHALSAVIKIRITAQQQRPGGSVNSIWRRAGLMWPQKQRQLPKPARRPSG